MIKSRERKTISRICLSVCWNEALWFSCITARGHTYRLILTVFWIWTWTGQALMAWSRYPCPVQAHLFLGIPYTIWWPCYFWHIRATIFDMILHVSKLIRWMRSDWIWCSSFSIPGLFLLQRSETLKSPCIDSCMSLTWLTALQVFWSSYHELHMMISFCIDVSPAMTTSSEL